MFDLFRMRNIAKNLVIAESAGQLGRENEAAIQAATGLSKNMSPSHEWGFDHCTP